MTVVTEVFTDALDNPVEGTVTFILRSMTQDDDGSGIIAPCQIPAYTLVNGVLTTGNLEPGLYDVLISLICAGCSQNLYEGVTVPAIGPKELWPLILEAVPLPPGANPYVVSIAGLSGIVTLAQLQALLFPDDDRSFSVTIGDGTAGPFAIAHNLGSTDIAVTIRDLSTGYMVGVSWKVVDANTISIEPDIIYPVNSRRVYVERVA